ncbi:MAG: sugar phosphate isomerase/epimerase [Acidobacteria bacterium]|nr:sugar phosphate isomerase/epimerase [Acidobacteriota bacterium]
MFWAGRDPLETVREVRSLGVSHGQILIPGDVAMDGAAISDWRAATESEYFTLVTCFAAYDGEDYADAPTIERTVGFIPRDTRAAREARTIELSDFAAALGIPSIACHVGFVPEHAGDPDRTAVRDMVRRICDHAAANGQTFAMETGQEPADVLLEFLREVDRPNLKINFDPANMIMYGTGDPIEALGVLGPHVISVHAKDGVWPPAGVPRGLGSERPLGQGDVGMERFIAKLKSIGYDHPVNIERECHDPGERLRDIRAGVQLLRAIIAS